MGCKVNSDLAKRFPSLITLKIPMNLSSENIINETPIIIPKICLNNKEFKTDHLQNSIIYLGLLGFQF